MFTVCFQHFNRLKNWVYNIPENICHLEKVTLTCNLCRKKDLWIGVLVWHIPQAFQTWVLKQPQRITQGDAYIPHYRCYFVAFLKSVSNWIICMNNILETVPYFLKPISGNGNICPIPPGACVWHPSWPNDCWAYMQSQLLCRTLGLHTTLRNWLTQQEHLKALSI